MAINADIQQQVFDLLSKASNISFVSVEQANDTVMGLVPGQRVTAEVLSMLPDSRVQVQVGGEKLNLNLPMAVRPGQNLEMTFVSAEPRSTFAIARPASPLAPPVTLSDASRLLGLLVSSEQIPDATLRASLQSVGDIIRHSTGDSSVLANLMDEALTYGMAREGGRGGTVLDSVLSGQRGVVPDQLRLAAFENNAAQILQQIARNSRFNLVEAVRSPVVPLALLPGEEVDALVQGTLPGGRVLVQVAGTSLELQLPRAVRDGEILHLTVISSQPKPVFAMARSVVDGGQGTLSEAGRWLSVLEHTDGGASDQQMFVLNKLNAVLKNIPSDSPVFAAVSDDAATYQSLLGGRRVAEAGSAAASIPAAQLLQPGNGVVLSDDMAKLLQALIKGNRLALLEELSQQSNVIFAPGQMLKGEVLAFLGGGRFMVQVAGQNLEFVLPKGVQRGDRFNLFFVGAEPKPLFLMMRSINAGNAKVSDAGRWLSSLLGETAGAVSAQEAFGIMKALLSGPPLDAAQVGRMMQQGLRESGLFYESHLARWFGGEYPLEALLREPQGRLSPSRHQLAMAEGGGATSQGGSANLIKQIPLELLEAAFSKAGAAMGHEGLADQHALPVVREQLASLQAGQILFRGDLFPGQPFEWTVAERDSGQGGVDAAKERGWDTTLKVDLPHLGAVSVAIRLNGGRVRLDVVAADGNSCDILTAGRQGLQEQLESAGLVPEEIGFRHEK